MNLTPTGNLVKINSKHLSRLVFGMTHNMKKELHGEKGTLRFAKEFAKTLKGGDTIALIGELGAGKTTFARGLAKAFGVKERITSPTFVYMHVHKTRKENILFVHADAYRGDADTLREIGIGEYLADPKAIVVIEWADKVNGILPEDTVTLKFSHLEGGVRVVEF